MAPRWPAARLERGFGGFSVSHLENQYGIPPGSHEHHHEDEGHDEDHEDHAEQGEEEEDNNIRLDIEQTRYDGVLHIHEPFAGLDMFRGMLTYTDYEHVELPVRAYMNDDAEFFGVEFDSEFTVFSAGEGDLLLGLRADYIHGELDSGADVPRLAPTRFGASLTWAHSSWNLSASVLDAAEQEKPGANEEATEGYTRWDAGAEYRMPLFGRGEMVVFAKLKNISDEEIRLSTSFLREVAPEPGRSLEAGFRLYF